MWWFEITWAATSSLCRCCKPRVKRELTERKDNYPVKVTIALFVVGLLSACLVGCATPGRSYDNSEIAMIQKEVTTEAPLMDWFGAPSSRSLGPEGSKTLSWRFSPGKGCATSSPGRLEVRLGAGGNVTTYLAYVGSK